MAAPGKSRERITVYALGLLLIATIAAILLSTTLTMSRASVRQTEDVMRLVADRAASEAEVFLTPAERLTALAADLVEDDVVSETRPERFEEYLRDSLHADDHVAGLFLGRNDGSFFYVMRSDEVDTGGTRTKVIQTRDGVREVRMSWRDSHGTETRTAVDNADAYDPRTRPWYQEATSEGQLIWTGVYTFFSSREPGVTVAAPVGNDGVFGVDVELAQLSTILASIEISPSGGTFLMDATGLLVATSHGEAMVVTEAEEIRRLAPSDLGDPVIAAAAIAPDSATSFSVDGRHYRVLHESFSDGHWPWTLVVYAPTDEFLTDLRQTLAFNNVLGVGIGGLALLVGIALLSGIRKPMERLRRRVQTDELTGLATRTVLDQWAARLAADAAQGETTFAVMMIDADYFKRVNDDYGHLVGDEILRAIARRMRRTLQETDLLVRYGGEEFLAVATDTSSDEALAIAERLRRAVSGAPINTTAGPIPMAVSIGVTISAPGAVDMTALTGEADKALYAAKHAGRDRVRTAEPAWSERAQAAAAVSAIAIADT